MVRRGDGADTNRDETDRRLQPSDADRAQMGTEPFPTEKEGAVVAGWPRSNPE